MARLRSRAVKEGYLSHLSVLILRFRSGGAARRAAGALAESVMDHDLAGVIDKLIVVAEDQAMAGGRIQPARRGVGVMVACEDHAFQRLVKVEINLELEVPHMVSPVVDVEGLKLLVRGLLDRFGRDGFVPAKEVVDVDRLELEIPGILAVDPEGDAAIGQGAVCRGDTFWVSETRAAVS